MNKAHCHKNMEKFNITRDNSILLVIDIQDRLSKSMFNESQLKKNCKILLELANAYSIPIIITEQNPNSLGNTNQELLDVAGNVPVIAKMEFTAFNKTLEDFLIKHNKTHIIVVGMETHVCVYQTTRDLLQNNYNATIISDAVGSRSEFNYHNGLELLNRMGAIISNTECLLFDMIKTSSDSKFKELQKLIK